MILSAQTLDEIRPVSPWEPRTRAFGMSYGLGPAGYDIRIKERYKLLSKGFMLASSMERFKMPDNVLGYVKDKSSWARQGLFVQNTVIEPGWEGYLTLEITNHGKLDIQLEQGMPIAQVVFHFLDKATVNPYDGKYQNQQSGPVGAIFER